jgi:hypothetical protein
MDQYIRQLIEDMGRAAGQAPPPNYSRYSEMDEEQAFQEEMEEIEKFVEGKGERLEDIIGIPQSLLPEDEKLSDAQLQRLVKEMEKLLQAWNFYPEYPENAPARMKYQALREIWINDFIHMTEGMVHINFCGDNGKNCIFPGYCNHHTDIGDVADESLTEDFFFDGKDLPFGHDGPKRTNTDDEGFIPGIYNYCDRWCERCDFTEVCRTFSMEDEFRAIAEKRAGMEEGEEDDADVSDDEFLAAFDFDDDDMEEEDGDDIDDSFFNDIDFDIDPDELEDPREDFFSPHNKAERHPLTTMVDKFMDDSNEWIEVQYKEVEDNFTKYVAIGNTDELMEAFDVIMRYHFFVPIKLRRALSGYFEQHEDEFEAFDMNGTAKVMLIAIDDSLLALKVLKRYFKDKKEIIDKLIVQLTEILSQAGGLFPDARSFIRPGLDE